MNSVADRQVDRLTERRYEAHVNTISFSYNSALEFSLTSCSQVEKNIINYIFLLTLPLLCLFSPFLSYFRYWFFLFFFPFFSLSTSLTSDIGLVNPLLPFIAFSNVTFYFVLLTWSSRLSPFCLDKPASPSPWPALSLFLCPLLLSPLRPHAFSPLFPFLCFPFVHYFFSSHRLSFFHRYPLSVTSIFLTGLSSRPFPDLFSYLPFHTVLTTRCTISRGTRFLVQTSCSWFHAFADPMKYWGRSINPLVVVCAFFERSVAGHSRVHA